MTLCGGTVQFQHPPDDKAYNLERIEHFVRKAAARKVQILTFPEMCITGYRHVRHLSREQIAELAEPVSGGPSTQRVRELARRYSLIVGAGLIETGEDGELYNCYVVCLPDGAVHKHRKLHCFISEHMAGGTASRSPHALGRIDLELWERREEDPAAIEAEFRGGKGRDWLMRRLPARAHDNGMFILFSNGVGTDDDEVRTGNAMIIDCYGRIVNETWKARDELVVADLDLSLIPLSTGRRWLRGRRPELYGPITEASGRELDPRSARFSEKPTEQ